MITAFEKVPRAAFVPEHLVERAYIDEPLPIPHDQVTTQPSLVAKMIEALRVSPEDKVLEIGTGYGFQSALLAHLAGFVWSVERWQDIAETAGANLDRMDVHNVEVVTGDGTLGLPDHSPYDAILVSAAFSRVPAPLAEQLGGGGRLVQPIGSGGDDDVTLFEKTDEGLRRIRSIVPARFVRLYGAHGFNRP